MVFLITATEFSKAFSSSSVRGNSSGRYVISTPGFIIPVYLPGAGRNLSGRRITAARDWRVAGANLGKPAI